MPQAIEVNNLTMEYRNFIVQKDISFSVKSGEIFVVMGDSGCGKSTLMRHLIGLNQPIAGDITYAGKSLWGTSPEDRLDMMRHFGVLFQTGALWSSLTLAQNVSLPLEQFTTLSTAEIKDIVSYKLALVGLAGFEKFYPAELSGSMQKRAGLARAMALDPKVLFCDEPLSGLDPIASKRLDDLLLHIRDSLGTTMIIVTHDLESIFGIADNAIFLDADTKTLMAMGDPHLILKETTNPKIRQFLTRSR